MNKCLTLWSHTLPESVTFNFQRNYFQTSNRTSYAGNVYYLGFRLSDEICIFLDIGCQSKFIYVNSIEIYNIANGKKTWIGERIYSKQHFSETLIESETNSIILEKVMDYCKTNRIKFDMEEMKIAIRSKVAKTYLNQVTAFSDLRINK